VPSTSATSAGCVATARHAASSAAIAAGRARALAAGDLAVRLPNQGRDEIDQLAAAFNHFVDDLATLLTELANQQLSYEAVLKSSSMIMKMSLVNYL